MAASFKVAFPVACDASTPDRGAIILTEPVNIGG